MQKKKKDQQKKKTPKDEGLVLGGKRIHTVPRRNKVDCKDCIIVQINKVKFTKKNQYVEYKVKENKKEIIIKAIPSKKDCPCEWSKFAIEYSVILTGKRDIMRKSIFSSLNETVKFDAAKNPNHFTFSGCSVTIKISKLNKDMRNGNVRRGKKAFRDVMVPLRIAGGVRCGKKWRKFQIRFLDA